MKTLTQLASQVNDFNEAFKIGGVVTIRMDDGSKRVCTVKHPATLMNRLPVGWFNEISGCYDLNRVVNVY